MRKGYRDLKVWQKSIELVEEIYTLTDKFPDEEKYGLVAQLRRAAISIPSNIAEGYRRNNLGYFIQFLSTSNGSAAELETQLIIARKLKNTSKLDYTKVDLLLEEILKMLSVLISNTGTRRKLK